MEKLNFSEYIKKAGKVERTKEFLYPNIEGFYVKLTYASKFIWNQIRESSKTTRIQAGRRSQDDFNEEAARREYALRVIQGWRGLTVGKMEYLIFGFFEFMK
ncbi:MAG: hypothetical protein ACTSR3_23625, partial [Candidatus Helarchaeota archaeon]